MNRTPLAPRRLLSALAVSLLVAGLAPAVASAAPATSAAPSASQGHKKHKMKVDAKVAKSRIKAGETTQVRGNLTDLTPNESFGAITAEPVVVQRLQGSTWVDVADGTCSPDGAFVLDLSFSLHASLSLRVFHPETDLYVSAYSSIFALVVL